MEKRRDREQDARSNATSRAGLYAGPSPAGASGGYVPATGSVIAGEDTSTAPPVRVSRRRARPTTACGCRRTRPRGTPADVRRRPRARHEPDARPRTCGSGVSEKRLGVRPAERSAGPQHAVAGVDEGRRVGDVLDDVGRDDEVERPAANGRASPAATTNANVVEPGLGQAPASQDHPRERDVARHYEAARRASSCSRAQRCPHRPRARPRPARRPRPAGLDLSTTATAVGTDQVAGDEPVDELRRHVGLRRPVPAQEVLERTGGVCELVGHRRRRLARPWPGQRPPDRPARARPPASRPRAGAGWDGVRRRGGGTGVGPGAYQSYAADQRLRVVDHRGASRGARPARSVSTTLDSPRAAHWCHSASGVPPPARSCAARPGRRRRGAAGSVLRYPRARPARRRPRPSCRTGARRARTRRCLGPGHEHEGDREVPHVEELIARAPAIDQGYGSAAPDCVHDQREAANRPGPMNVFGRTTATRKPVGRADGVRLGTARRAPVRIEPGERAVRRTGCGARAC